MTRRQPDGGVPLPEPAVFSQAPYAQLVHNPWVLALALAVVTFVVYQPVWHAGFIWDDGVLITYDRMVHARDGLYRFWFTTDAVDYYPATSSLLWLQWHLWGNTAMGWHVVNVALHAGNVVLIWLVFRRLRIPGAWLGALLFAIHPVNVATVAWVSEQKNTLSMLFSCLSILWYLRFDGQNRRRWYGLSLGAFVLALFSKPAVVMLPVVLWGCVWWVHRKLGWTDVLRTAPYFIASLAIGLVTIWFQDRGMHGHLPPIGGVASRLAVAGAAPWFYLYKVVVPLNLCMVYPQWDPASWGWSGLLPGLALVAGFALLGRNCRGWGGPLLFGLGSFVVMLVPVLGFINQGFYQYARVADHWQYYSIVGATALAGAGFVKLGQRLQQTGRRMIDALGMAGLVLLGFLTWGRCQVFHDPVSLFLDNLRHNPSAWIADYNLGYIRMAEGNIGGAVRYFQEALRIKPDCAEAHNNLGLILATSGRTGEAIAEYELALKSLPDDAEAHNNLASALYQMGRTEEAIEHFQQALRIRPDYAEAEYNLGCVLLQSGRMTEATDHLQQALRINPDYAQAHYALGVGWQQAGRVAEARTQYNEALRINPDYVPAQEALARLPGEK